MKKILVSLSVLVLLGVAAIPTAIGYVYPDGYNFNYVYNYSSSDYGPVPYYSSTMPVYRVTSAYGDPMYGTGTAYSYNYNYSYQYGPTAPITGMMTNTSDRFIDVPVSDPNYAAIQWLGNQGIAGGFDGGRYFRPSSNISRSQFVVMVVKGRKINPSASQYRYCYGDVSTGTSANEICYAKAAGWLPYNSTNFDSGVAISVSDIRYIIERAYGAYPYSLASYGYMTRSDAAGVLYTSITRYGSYPVNTPVATSPVYTYPGTTTARSDYYQYNPYNGDYHSPRYCETGSYYYYDSNGKYVRCGGVTTTATNYNNNNYSYPYYGDTSYNNSYYSNPNSMTAYNYNSGYNSGYNSYNDNYYSRNVRYQDPMTVYVPYGYNGPWN